MARTDWTTVVNEAKTIVESYDTSVTLRQLFYRLVAQQTLENTNSAYKSLSSKTAEARRAGEFPDLIDRGRTIHRYRSFSSPEALLKWGTEIYRRDRTEGQDVSLYLGVEKAGMVIQLQAWFGHLDSPILALGGYSSQTYVKEVQDDVDRQDRPAVLLYAGDFDPSGEDIDRDFVERTACFDKVVRVALSAEQVIDFDLPPAVGKATDSRASRFIARHGALVQVELDALWAVPSSEPVLQRLYAEAMDEFWDVSAYQAIITAEAEERRWLQGRAA